MGDVGFLDFVRRGHYCGVGELFVMLDFLA